MSQLPLIQPSSPASWSVTELTRYLRDLLESDANLRYSYKNMEAADRAMTRWAYYIRTS